MPSFFIDSPSRLRKRLRTNSQQTSHVHAFTEQEQAALPTLSHDQLGSVFTGPSLSKFPQQVAMPVLLEMSEVFQLHKLFLVPNI